MIRCRVCCDLTGRPCIACSKASRIVPTGNVVWCALCECRGHVSKFCPRTSVGNRRMAETRQRRFSRKVPAFSLQGRSVPSEENRG